MATCVKPEKQVRAWWLVLAITVLSASMAPAAFLRNVPQTLRQPDGTVVHLFATGDEYYNRLHDAQGFTIVRDPATGYLVYANKIEGRLLPSPFVVGEADPAALHLEKDLLPDPQTLPDTRSLFSAGRRMGAHATAPQSAPVFSQINNIVVYIRFSDETDAWQPLSTYDAWLNQAGASATSMKAFFLEASYGQLTIDSTFYPTPSGTTLVSYQDSHPRAYYKPYDAIGNPQGYQSAERGQREHTLLGNAINAIASQVPFTLNVDTNSDGYVDSVVFIVSGWAVNADWSNLLWPHKWSMSSDYAVQARINGKVVDDYDLQLDGNLLGSGVFCHEMTHLLGAPDLYRYSSCSSNTNVDPVGRWDLMDVDRDPPQHMGSYMKWRYLGFIPNIPAITTSGSYQLHSLPTATNNCYKIASPNSSSEYFVLEYRRKTGTFETSVPGSGLLVYRINTAADGQGNACGPPDEVYIYRPGGTLEVNGNLSSAAFSSDTARTAMDDTTDPSSFLSNGFPGRLSIANVGTAGDTISFNVNVLQPCVPGAFSLTAPTNGASLPSGTTSTQLTWNAAANATSYDVYFGTDQNPPLLGNQTGTSVTVTVTEGATYFWKVMAKNNCGPTSAPASGAWAFNVGGQAGAVTIFSDDFEGAFPGKWEIYGVQGHTGRAYWGKVSCKTSGGAGAVWCAGSGNSAPAPCSQYIRNQGTFMIYGPFSLVDAVEGTLDFDLWADINDGGDPNNPPDYVMWMWSLDGQEFWGDGLSGTTNGWQHHTVQMSDAQVGENPQPILGQTQVWFAFVFISDPATSVLKEGAYVDNVSIKKMTSLQCAFSLSPASQSFGSEGGSNSVAINASGSTCPWTAASNSPWITITGAASGSGNATVTYSVQGNLGAARNGTLTIAGKSFTVNQSAASCGFVLSPTSAALPAGGGSGSFSVTTGSWCSWTALPDAAWLHLTGPASGTGNGTVSFGADANAGAARSGTITVQGQSFTVNQAATSCSYALSPTSVSMPAGGGSGSFGVTSESWCSWTAVANATWLHLTGGASGTGNGTVSYSADVNSGAARSGSVTVQGQSFTVNQAAGMRSVWIPAVIHKDVPSRNAWWRSDVAVLDRSASPANVTVKVYAPSGVQSKAITVPAKGQTLLQDVAGQLGITADSGALEVVSDQEVFVSGRTYSQVDATHTYGQDYNGEEPSALLSSGQSAWLPQLTQNGMYRTNVGITNTGTGTANVTVTLYDANGAQVWSDTRDYASGQFYQHDQPYLQTPAGGIDSGYAKVTVNSGSGIVAYASVIDQNTGDPTTIGMKFGATIGATPFSHWIPAAIHKDVPSRNAWWRSDLAVLNRSASSANVTVKIYAPSGMQSKAITLSGNGQTLLQDVAGQLGIMADSGALEVVSDQDVFVTGRTYSQVDATHTYGQDYDGEEPAALLGVGESAWLPQLTQNALYRTNVGITNTGTGTANVTVTLYDASGNQVWNDTRDYAAGQFYQHDQPYLQTLAGGIDSGYAKVTVNSGSGIVAYASVIDQNTGDPTTISMKFKR